MQLLHAHGRLRPCASDAAGTLTLSCSCLIPVFLCAVYCIVLYCIVSDMSCSLVSLLFSLCEFFKAGKCVRGAKCKYSHDMELARKSAKIDVYSDPREQEKANDTMDTVRRGDTTQRGTTAQSKQA